jgi:hypothetical protein
MTPRNKVEDDAGTARIYSARISAAVAWSPKYQLTRDIKLGKLRTGRRIFPLHHADNRGSRPSPNV